MPDRVTVGVRIRPLNARELASPRSHPAWRAKPSSSTILSVPVPASVTARTPRPNNNNNASSTLSPAITTLPSSSSTSSFSSSSTTTTTTSTLTSATTTTISPTNNNTNATSFRYDAVFGTAASNAHVYARLVSPLVHSVLHDGLTHATVFAYGQTSSGKTHTMLGQVDDPGVVARAIADIFTHVLTTNTHNNNNNNNIVVSYVEIYNERIRDLLSPHARAMSSTTTAGASASASDLVLRDDGAGHVHLVGVTLQPVATEAAALAALHRGQGARRVAGTRMNATSSRSHAVFTLHFVQSGAQLTLVDLAGSERAAATSGCTSGTSNCGGRGGVSSVSHPNTRLQEGAHINQSLLVLGSIISRLAKSSTSTTTTTSSSSSSNKKKTAVAAAIAHLPFRDSKLTRLLRPALSGHGRTVVLCNVTPALAFFDETLSTLKFANRAKNLPVKPNGDVPGAAQKRTGAEYYRAKYDEVSQEVARLRQQFRDLEQEVVALRAASTASTSTSAASAATAVAAAVTAASAAVASTSTDINNNNNMKKMNQGGNTGTTASETNATKTKTQDEKRQNNEEEKKEEIESTTHRTTTTTTTTASLTLSVQASVHSETSSSSASSSASHFTPPPAPADTPASPAVNEHEQPTASSQRSHHRVKRHTTPSSSSATPTTTKSASVATAINFDTDTEGEGEEENDHDHVHDSPRVSLCSRSTCNATSSPRSCSPSPSPPPLPPRFVVDDDDDKVKAARLGRSNDTPEHQRLHAEVRQLRGRIAGVEQENKRLTQRFLNMVTGYKTLQMQACKLRSGVARIGKRPHRHLLGARGGGVGGGSGNGGGVSGSGGHDTTGLPAVVVGRRGDTDKTEMYESRYGSITSRSSNGNGNGNGNGNEKITAAVNIHNHNHNHYHMISASSNTDCTSNIASSSSCRDSSASPPHHNKTRRRNTAVIQRVTLSSMFTASGTLSMDPTIGAATALALHLADLFREQSVGDGDSGGDRHHLRLSSGRAQLTDRGRRSGGSDEDDEEEEGDGERNNRNGGVFAPLVNLLKSMFGGGGEGSQ